MRVPEVAPKKRILIAGASGFLGGRLAFHLAQEALVFAFGRTAPHDSSGLVRWIPDDMADIEVSARRLASLSADVVVNCAAVIDPQMCEDPFSPAHAINSEWPGAIARALLNEVPSRFIHISSDAVFDGRSGNYSEDDECSPRSAYGMSKLLAEQAVLSTLPQALVIRTNFIGGHPGGRGFANSVVAAVRDNTQYTGYSDYVTSSIHVDCLSRTIGLLSSMDASGVLHVASRNSASKAEQARFLVRLLEGPADTVVAVKAPARRGRPTGRYDLSLNVGRLSRQNGLTMPTIENSLEDVAKEFRRTAQLDQQPGDHPND
jgi:dTDP-4-dehydrorhamnose reductase